MRLTRICSGSLALGAVAGLATSAGAANIPLHRFTEIALDPAGSQVASIEGETAPDSLSLTAQKIVVRSTTVGKGKRAEPVPRVVAECADCSYTGVGLAASGELAYLVRTADGQTDVMLSAEGQPRRLARINGHASAPRWSPDGRTLALLVTIAPRKEAGPTQAGARAVGEQGGPSDRRRLALIDRESGELRFAGPSDIFVYEVDWLRDGSGLVGIATTGDGDNDWYLARLYAFSGKTSEARLIATPERQIMSARVSPDGRQVAFIGGLMSDYNVGGGDIYTVSIDGGTPVNVTPGIEASFTSVQWRGKDLVAAGRQKDASVFVGIDPGSGRSRMLRSDTAFAIGGTFSGDGLRFAGVRSSFDRGPELAAGPIEAIRPLTAENGDLPGLVSAQSLTWQNDGREIQGWLLTPRRAAPASKMPMVVVIHGGPAGDAGPDFIWDGWRRALIDKGYALFYPNFRGSAGRGEAFKQANILDFGKGDLRDILTGVDMVEAMPSIDADRVGITGFSYGGYMTMWAVTQTNRFKAAAAGASVANWISYYGQNGIDKWLLPYFGGSPHQNPAPYNAASPINFVRNVKTPTFIYVGERDIETPPAQSREFWKALREQDVPTSFLIYPDEGHRLRNPANAADAAQRIADWFDHYMPPVSKDAK